MTTYNIYLGWNELLVVFRNGIHHVLEEDEGYEAVFTGHYEECVKYCKARYKEYMEATIG
jgi:hypothetical protein